MKKVLLIGSSYSSAPILNELRKRRFDIAVCGNQRADPCHEYADRSFFIDYSDTDQLRRLIKNEHFDYLVPSCNDYSYMSAVPVAQEMGYPGFDNPAAAEIIHTKHKFREFTKAHGISAPNYTPWDISDESSWQSLRFPLLLKPVDAFSGRGVIKINKSEEFQNALSHALDGSRTRNIVIEEFVDGSLHSHSAFIINGVIAQDFFVDEFCSVYPYQVDCSNHPSFLAPALREIIRRSVDKIIEALGLCDGLLHTQFIADGEDALIIECMRRAPGDLFSNLISYSTRCQYTNMYVQPFIDEPLTIDNAEGAHRHMARHTISVDKPCTLFSFSHSIPSKNVSIVPLKNSGHSLRPAPYDKAAIVFAEMESEEQLRKVTPDLKSHISICSLEGNSLA